MPVTLLFDMVLCLLPQVIVFINVFVLSNNSDEILNQL